QPVEEEGSDELGLKEVRNSGPEHAATLQRITEDPWEEAAPGERPGARRRNRLLDHLLARVGDQFTDYSLLQSSDAALLASGGSESQATSAERLARDKRAFLRDYSRISRDRGVGFNYLAPGAEGTSDFLPGDCTNPAELMQRLTASSADP